jgi:hypothetical protein
MSGDSSMCELSKIIIIIIDFDYLHAGHEISSTLG